MLDKIKNGITLEVQAKDLKETCLRLRDDPNLKFEMLIDLCGVDYLTYGQSEWETEISKESSFSRAVTTDSKHTWQQERFAVVYHLLSITHNHRLRVRSYPLEQDETPRIDSITSIWNNANWYEREAFDLYGISFNGHPDLRRLLTDYGFEGHPLRKDFPVSGHVEVRYDEELKKVIYQPVSIEPRTLVPRTIREIKTKVVAD